MFERLLEAYLALPSDARAVIISAIVGGMLGITGAIIGGRIQARTWYQYQQKRAAVEKRERWIRIAREWAAKGRHHSLRLADLNGADLRGVDLAADTRHSRADLAFSNLQDARLSNARLRYASLESANLRGAHLENADLREANLRFAALHGASLSGADLGEAQLEDAEYDDGTTWPDGFTPPSSAVRSSG